MPSKLKFYITPKGEKVYTLKEEVKQKGQKEQTEQTKDAHHKFIKLKSLNPDSDELRIDEE